MVRESGSAIYGSPLKWLVHFESQPATERVTSATSQHLIPFNDSFPILGIGLLTPVLGVVAFSDSPVFQKAVHGAGCVFPRQ